MCLVFCSFIFLAQQPYSGLGRHIIEVPRSHTDTPQSVGLLWTSDQPIVGDTQLSQYTDILAPAGFEPAVPSKRAVAARRPGLCGRWDRNLTAILYGCITITNHVLRLLSFEHVVAQLL